MDRLKAVEQKIKGKAQQVEGGVKGGLKRIEGKANEEIADAKLEERTDLNFDDDSI